MQNGMGGTLSFSAIVVALGAMFGKILHETGALDQIAVKLLNSFGENGRITRWDRPGLSALSAACSLM